MSEGFYEREVGARWDEILELWEAGELDEALEKARALIIDLDALLGRARRANPALVDAFIKHAGPPRD